MTLKDTSPAACGNFTDRWIRVAFLNGELAAAAGVARSSNPHPAGSASARSWLAGWRTRTATAPTPPEPLAAWRPSRHEGDTTMDLIEKLPGLADDDLGTLVTNAERLAHSGTPKQQKAAQAMLPAIQAEVDARRERKAAMAPPKRTPRAGRKAAAPSQTA
ncbi:MAG TPA: hypothetical protein VD978_30675 [Azospirillum sp.]|nr:hypothetical protein [Azospirillum sp.]